MSRNFRASAFAFWLEANFRLNLTCIRILGSSGHWTRVGCFFFFRQWLCEWMFWHKYACRMYLKKSPTYPWKAKWSTPLYKLECLLSVVRLGVPFTNHVHNLACHVFHIFANFRRNLMVTEHNSAIYTWGQDGWMLAKFFFLRVYGPRLRVQ